MHAQRTTSRPRVATGAHAFRKPDEELAFAIGDTELGLRPDRAQHGRRLFDPHGFERRRALRRSRRALPESQARTGRCRARQGCAQSAALHREARGRSRPCARCTRHPVAAPRMVRPARGCRREPRSLTPPWPPALGEPGSARAVARACAENAIALAIQCQPRHPEGRHVVRLSSGVSSESAPCSPRRLRDERVWQRPQGFRVLTRDAEIRVGSYDWGALSADLNAQGCTVMPKLLSPAECAQLAAVYPQEKHFRSPCSHGAARLRQGRIPLFQVSVTRSGRGDFARRSIRILPPWPNAWNERNETSTCGIPRSMPNF